MLSEIQKSSWTTLDVFGKLGPKIESMGLGNPGFQPAPPLDLLQDAVSAPVSMDLLHRARDQGKVTPKRLMFYVTPDSVL